MDLKRKEVLELDRTLDANDVNGKYTRAVQAKFTTNKFAMSAVIKDNETFIEKLQAEYYKSIKKTEKEIQGLDEDDKKEIGEGFQKFVESHPGYYDFLEEKVRVKLSPVYVNDLKSCDYKPSLMFSMLDKIFFEKKPTVKATAN